MREVNRLAMALDGDPQNVDVVAVYVDGSEVMAW